MMDPEQFHTLMDELKQSRDKMKELKREAEANNSEAHLESKVLLYKKSKVLLYKRCTCRLPSPELAPCISSILGKAVHVRYTKYQELLHVRKVRILAKAFTGIIH